MTNYPDSIYSPRVRENRAGVEYDETKKTIWFKEDGDAIENEIIALETELGLKPRSRARAYRATSVQSIPTGDWTKIQLNEESYDELSEFDPVTNFRFTATKAGYYLVAGVILFSDAVADKSYAIAIKKSSAFQSLAYLSCALGTDHSIHISDIVYLGVGDYLELFAYQGSGANRDIYFGLSRTYMAIHKLSPA